MLCFSAQIPRSKQIKLYISFVALDLVTLKRVLELLMLVSYAPSIRFESLRLGLRTQVFYCYLPVPLINQPRGNRIVFGLVPPAHS